MCRTCTLPHCLTRISSLERLLKLQLGSVSAFRHPSELKINILVMILKRKEDGGYFVY